MAHPESVIFHDCYVTMITMSLTVNSLIAAVLVLRFSAVRLTFPFCITFTRLSGLVDGTSNGR